MTLMILKKHSLTSAREWTSLLLLKWAIKLMGQQHINKLKKNLKNSNEPKSSTERTCSKCGETKPLDSNHYQVIKYFRSGLSYYCNECNKPKPKEDQ